MYSTNQSDTHPPATNWRPVIAQGIAIWLAILIGLVYVPSSHPAAVGIVLSMILGAPLLPVALVADLRQARHVSECPPTTGEYFQNVLTDMTSSVFNRTALGTERTALFDCGPRNQKVCGCH
jgi:hypothetical protein